ncbi:MAG TPA: hypothetical protein VNI54_03840 [Thermoanaerobaculia bacterium]|nr:hypothetical protein [Thermoanaerobaculia bacterium]
MPHIGLLAGSETHPVLTWDLATDALTIDGETVAPDAVFVRHDVFSTPSAARAFAWYTTAMSWAMAHPEVRLLNRRHPAHLLKPQQLLLARECGLEIPSTVITNDATALQSMSDRVVKPVAGGEYTQPLDAALASAPRRGNALAAPAIVQETLVPPELRIYRAGDRFVSFHVVASTLDYRTDRNARVEPVQNDRRLVAGLRKLTDALHLDFAAADFKQCPASGRMLFLEVNSGPMFAAFDAVSDRAVSRAIVRALRAHLHIN